eukprot:6058770-Pyramimonas_sp.AAC.1
MCSGCGEEKPRDMYSGSMWEERPRPRECMQCVERAAAERNKKVKVKSCMARGEEQPEAAFSRR